MTNGSNGSKLLLKNTEEDQEKECTVSFKQRLQLKSLAATIVANLSDLDGIFILKE